MQEIENLKRLSHRFIVKLIGYCLPSEDAQNKFVVMEYIAGGSLLVLLQEPPAWFRQRQRLRSFAGSLLP